MRALLQHAARALIHARAHTLHNKIVKKKIINGVVVAVEHEKLAHTTTAQSQPESHWRHVHVCICVHPVCWNSRLSFQVKFNESRANLGFSNFYHAFCRSLLFVLVIEVQPLNNINNDTTCSIARLSGGYCCSFVHACVWLLMCFLCVVLMRCLPDLFVFVCVFVHCLLCCLCCLCACLCVVLCLMLSYVVFMLCYVVV